MFCVIQIVCFFLGQIEVSQHLLDGGSKAFIQHLSFTDTDTLFSDFKYKGHKVLKSF